MADNPKPVGDDEIVENPEKRTISQANKELREEQKGDDRDTMRDAAEDIRMNKGLGRRIQPKENKSRGEEKLAETAEKRENAKSG